MVDTDNANGYGNGVTEYTQTTQHVDKKHTILYAVRFHRRNTETIYHRIRKNTPLLNLCRLCEMDMNEQR